MPITAVHVEPITGQIQPDLAIISSLGQHLVGQYVLVRLTDDQGRVGLGEASVTSVWSGESQAGTIALILDVLAPLVIGADPFDTEWISRRMDRGDVPWQPRLRSVSQLHWVVPVGQGRRYGSRWPAALRWILGGWETTDIFTASSGDHLTPSYSGYDASGLGIFSGRPDVIGNPSVSHPSISLWFNPSAFSIPGAAPDSPLKAPPAPIGRFGNAGVGILTGPGWWQNDWGLVKQMPLRERLRLNLFVLATNVFNHINPTNPNLAITSPQLVGKIFNARFDNNTSGIGPRVVQLGLRIDF